MSTQQIQHVLVTTCLMKEAMLVILNKSELCEPRFRTHPAVYDRTSMYITLYSVYINTYLIKIFFLKSI